MSDFKFGDIVKDRKGRIGVVFQVHQKHGRTTVRVGHPHDHPKSIGSVKGYFPCDLGLVSDMVVSAPPPNTVRVRIAVATNEHGHWFAVGWHHADNDDNMIGCCRNQLPGERRLSWVYADIPMPEKPAEIQGVVE